LLKNKLLVCYFLIQTYVAGIVAVAKIGADANPATRGAATTLLLALGTGAADNN
jgi:hypothetical protein